MWYNLTPDWRRALSAPGITLQRIHPLLPPASIIVWRLILACGSRETKCHYDKTKKSECGMNRRCGHVVGGSFRDNSMREPRRKCPHFQHQHAGHYVDAKRPNTRRRLSSYLEVVVTLLQNYDQRLQHVLQVVVTRLGCWHGHVDEEKELVRCWGQGDDGLPRHSDPAHGPPKNKQPGFSLRVALWPWL